MIFMNLKVISTKEDHEEYKLKSTFDNRKLQNIQNLYFDLKAPEEGLLRYINKKHMYRKYTNIKKYKEV